MTRAEKTDTSRSFDRLDGLTSEKIPLGADGLGEKVAASEPASPSTPRVAPRKTEGSELTGSPLKVRRFAATGSASRRVER